MHVGSISVKHASKLLVNITHFNLQVNDETAEITYESSDNVRFRIHTIYLKAHSGVLAPPDGTSLQEVVHLTESASVLELLFKFIYPVTQPVLELEANIEVLMDLAEAAEKYQVFPAMYACYLEMQSVLPNHAIFVVGYALKHGYADLVDEAAPHAIDASFPDVIRGIPFEFLASWMKYHEMWKNIRKRALSLYLQSHGLNTANVWVSARKLSSFRNCEESFPSLDPQWLSSVKADSDAIPKMSVVVGLPEGNQDPDEDSISMDGVTIQSCDGIQHQAELDILRACSKGLYDLQAGGIQVPETSSVIYLLLQHLRPTRLPDLTRLPFEELKALALAAEKYRIHPAMGICRIMMKRKLPNRAKEIFHYAFETRYFDVLDLAAQGNVNQSGSLLELIQDMPSILFAPWAHYYQKWRDVNIKALHEIKQMSKVFSRSLGESNRKVGGFYVERCHCSQSFVEAHLLPVVTSLLEDAGCLANLDFLFPALKTCSEANDFFNQCRSVAEKLTRDIPPFSSLL